MADIKKGAERRRMVWEDFKIMLELNGLNGFKEGMMFDLSSKVEIEI